MEIFKQLMFFTSACAALLMQPAIVMADSGSTKKRVVSTKDLPKETKQFLKKFKYSGTYEFVDKDGKQYIGRSNNVERRLKEHIRTGKLPVGNISNSKSTGEYAPRKRSFKGSDVISVAEKTKIKTASVLAKGKISNKQNNNFDKKSNTGVKLGRGRK